MFTGSLCLVLISCCAVSPLPSFSAVCFCCPAIAHFICKRVLEFCENSFRVFYVFVNKHFHAKSDKGILKGTTETTAQDPCGPLLYCFFTVVFTCFSSSPHHTHFIKHLWWCLPPSFLPVAITHMSHISHMYDSVYLLFFQYPSSTTHRTHFKSLVQFSTVHECTPHLPCA